MYRKSCKHISRLDKKNKQTPNPYKNLYKKICYAQPKEEKLILKNAPLKNP